MSIRFAPLLISLALLSGNALADHVIKTLVPTEVRKSYDGLLVAMAATALDAPEERHDWTGLYVGGFVGGAAGTRATTTQPKSPVVGTMSQRPPIATLLRQPLWGEVQLAIIGNLGNHLI